jgi:hypothetical protein
MFSLQQNWKKGQNRFCLEARGLWEKEEGGGEKGGDMNQTIYAHLNKLIQN